MPISRWARRALSPFLSDPRRDPWSRKTHSIVAICGWRAPLAPCSRDPLKKKERSSITSRKLANLTTYPSKAAAAAVQHLANSDSAMSPEICGFSSSKNALQKDQYDPQKFPTTWQWQLLASSLSHKAIKELMDANVDFLEVFSFFFLL